MANTETEKYQIILEKVPLERQPEAALFISGCFSLPPVSTRGIANSAPIVLISDMSRGQAEAVLAELLLSLPTGVELRMTNEKDSANISRLQWPRPPRIYGRDLAEFANLPKSHDLNCPICGGAIRISPDESGGFLATAVDDGERKRESNRSLSDASNTDPLFSGVKPLATSNFASLRSLSAGDTGFWMDHGNSLFASPEADIAASSTAPSDTANAKRSTGRIATGLSAFMKPGAFALVMGRTRDNQAVKMISEIMGITEDEAREKSMGLGLCIARDISLDEAQNLLARFKGLGVKARIVKPA